MYLMSDEDTYVTWKVAFEEVHAHFLTDLSDSDLQTARILFFRIEKAWWYYDDRICDVHPEWNLPRFRSLYSFSQRMFEYSPLVPNVTNALTVKEDNGKSRTVYVVVGVPEDFPFQPVARKEVSKVSWFRIDNIPKDTYAVTPFLGPLNEWLRQNKKKDTSGEEVSIPMSRKETIRERMRQKAKTQLSSAEESFTMTRQETPVPQPQSTNPQKAPKQGLTLRDSMKRRLTPEKNDPQSKRRKCK